MPGGDPVPGRLLLRSVRILLECILVLNLFVSYLCSARSKLQCGSVGYLGSNFKRFGLKLPVKVNDHDFEQVA